jgi:uncharacterized protein (TIGR03000 family)
MYSLVLMSAMSTAPATPEFNGFFRDLFFGCNGCYGCYGGGARYNCGGCDGFLGFGLVRRPLFDRGCYGCGGCYGSYAPAYGCGGSASFAPSYGCSGSMNYAPSYGGCYGSSSFSCYGGPAVSYSAGCYGSAIPSGTVIPTIPNAVVEPAPAGSTSNALIQATHTAAAQPQGARATVVVKLPANARLYAGDKLLTLTSGERKFVTPPLPDGEFTYRFKVEYDRDGETYSATQKVNVKAGKTVTVEFTESVSSNGGIKASVTTTAEPPAAPNTLVPAVTSPTAPAEKTDRATITVKLPPGATLYVDDKKSPGSEPVRQFTTPPIPTGKEYAYSMKAEIIRDGRPETITQKVSFKAGDKFTVDLTAGK